MTKESVVSNNATHIIMDLLRIGAYLHRVGNRVTGEYGLTQQQFAVLSEIQMKGMINQKQLIGELLYEKSNVSKIVKKLKSFDFIEISLSTEDMRVTILNVTNKGDEVVNECMEKFNSWNRDWIKPLTKEEESQTIQVLERLKKL